MSRRNVDDDRANASNFATPTPSGRPCRYLPTVNEDDVEDQQKDKRSPSALSQVTNMSQHEKGSTTDSECFDDFVTGLPFTLTFKAINYPVWARQPRKPLFYLPIPLEDLPDVPEIPSKLGIPLLQIVNSELFTQTIDGLLLSNNYNLSHFDVTKVYISYTHKNGTRTRLPMDLPNAESVLKSWAKDVYLGFLDMLPSQCTCEDCQKGGSERFGHGLEIEVVFPQGSKDKRLPKRPPPEYKDLYPEQRGRRPFHGG